MLTSKFRPWGELTWLLPKINVDKWHLLACLSTEDRCVGTIKFLAAGKSVKSATFIEVVDPNSEQNQLIQKKIQQNNAILTAECPDVTEIKKMKLLSSDEAIYNACNEFIKSVDNGNVILDISSFPKRFFFPFTKILINNDNVKNLIITYSQPDEYAPGDLSDDPEPWYPLPLFMSTEYPEPEYQYAIVGTGFMPFSLPKLLKDKHSQIELRLFFPFPPGPPNYQRSWEFVRKIEKHYNLKENDKIVRVNSLDVNEVFNYISYATENGNRKCILAPYGPKPISLAICLYASIYNSPVYYTQPKYYNPDYCSGTKSTNGYCIKLNGNNLFK